MAFSNFIPQVWSARLLEHLDKSLVYVKLLNRDYEGEIKQYGDTVKINQIGDISIKDYSGEDIDAPEDTDGTQHILNIDQQKYFNFRVKDVDNAQSKPKVMDAAMQRAAYAMADVLDQYAADLLCKGADTNNAIGSDGTPIVPTLSDAYDYLVDLATKLTEANVPKAGRWVVIPAWYHGLLLKDSRFTGSGTDYNKAILEGGEVGVAAGFKVYVSNNVPNTKKAKYKIIAGTNQAATFAEQLVETEPYRQEKNFSDAIKGLEVYGAKVLQSKCLAVLTVNPTSATA